MKEYQIRKNDNHVSLLDPEDKKREEKLKRELEIQRMKEE